MKRIIGIILTVALAATLLIGCSAPASTDPGSSPSSNTADKNIVSVSGKGEINITPDIATFSVGVRTQKVKAVDAQFENSTIMEKVLKKLTDSGIAEKDIQTGYMSLNEVYDYSKSTPKLIGYEVTNTLNVTVRTLDTLGQILSDVTASGATEVNNIQFSIEDKEAAYAQALEAAMQNALAKAQSLAKASGGGLAALPINISESNANYSMRSYSLEDVNFKTETSSDSTAVPISEGELSVTASITVDFELVAA